MNDMDRRIADDPTLTDAQKLPHKFGNAFIPLNVAIEEACDSLGGEWSNSAIGLNQARDTYLAEMREFIERMGEAKDKRIVELERELSIAGAALSILSPNKEGVE